MIPWLVVATLGLITGDLIAICPIPLALLAAIATTAAGLIVATADPLLRRLGVALLCLALGFSNADRTYRPVLPEAHLANLAVPATFEIEGRLAGDPETRPDQVRLRIAPTRVRTAAGWRPAVGLVSLSLQQARQPWAIGDRLQASIALRRPRNFGNPGEFDYQAYLARQQIYLTAFAYDDDDFIRIAATDASWSNWMGRWRRATRAAYRSGLPAADAQLLDALVLGSQRELPSALQDAFRRTGTSHILAISGLNVGLVAAAAYLVFRWLLGRSRRLLLRTNVHKVATGLSVLAIGLYAGIAGTNVSTVRALIMAVVLFVAVMIERRQRSIVSLAAAATLILLLWPGSARDPSFQLSFAAVTGLVLGMERFRQWSRRRAHQRMLELRGWRGRAENAAVLYSVISGVAMLSTVPLVAFHFNQLSLIAPLANAIAVPLLGSIAVGLGLLAALAALVSQPLAAFIALAALPALAAGRTVISQLAALPLAAVRLPSLTAIELILIYTAVGGCLLRLPAARKLIPTLALLALAVDGGWWWRARYHDSDLRITFLSVGQGDCAIAELPGGEVMVIDGGGISSRTFDVGERIIAPFLWSRKIARVDYLVLSHPQWDHYGGLRYLAEQFQPREFWWNGQLTEAPTFRGFLLALRQAGSEWQPLSRGMTRHLSQGGGVVEAEVLSPERDATFANLNEGSLVLSLGYRGRRVLFTGDVEHKAEHELVRYYGADLTAAVLKVPHHGSATSSTTAFLHAVRPAVAVISAGFANRFGLPSPKVLRRYAALGLPTLRTDVEGAIEVRIRADGTITVATTDSIAPLSDCNIGPLGQASGSNDPMVQSCDDPMISQI